MSCGECACSACEFRRQMRVKRAYFKNIFVFAALEMLKQTVYNVMKCLIEHQN